MSLETKTMNNINLFLAENPAFKIIKAVFPGNPKHYTYKTFYEVEPGKFAVVKTPSGELKVVEVVEVIPANECPLNFNFEIKWLVQIIDTEAYRHAKKTEAEIQKQLNKLAIQKQRTKLLEELSNTIGEEAVEVVKGIARL